ncbi:MAG: methyl-accepting chemotaxis protein [Acidimicrobiia bacterium]
MRSRLSRPHREPPPADAPSDAERALAAVTDVCARAASGDLEARLPDLGDTPSLRRIQCELNRLLDTTDAFVREAGAVLTASGQGRFHRRFLLAGMPGSFRRGAQTINTARQTMQTNAAQLDDELRARTQLISVIFDASAQVAAAATELGASADTLGQSTRQATAEAAAALQLVRALESSAEQIQHVAGLITAIAAQTNLLALNATIEAARAGDAGRGFSIVATEVKDLARAAASAAEQITQLIEGAQTVSDQASTAIAAIFEVIETISHQVTGIGEAAGAGNVGDGGLAQLAELLHGQLSRLNPDHAGAAP